MEYLTLIVINFFFCLLLYLYFRRKFNQEVGSGKVRQELEELVMLFNRQAEKNITILEARFDSASKLLDKTENEIKDFQVLTHEELQKNTELLKNKFSKKNLNKYKNKDIKNKDIKNITSNLGVDQVSKDDMDFDYSDVVDEVADVVEIKSNQYNTVSPQVIKAQAQVKTQVKAKIGVEDNTDKVKGSDESLTELLSSTSGKSLKELAAKHNISIDELKLRINLNKNK